MQKTLLSTVPFPVRNEGKPENLQNVLVFEKKTTTTHEKDEPHSDKICYLQEIGEMDRKAKKRTESLMSRSFLCRHDFRTHVHKLNNYQDGGKSNTMQTGISDPKSITNGKQNHTEGAKYEWINAGNSQTQRLDSVSSVSGRNRETKVKGRDFVVIVAVFFSQVKIEIL